MLVLSKTEIKKRILILFFLPLFIACNKDPEIPYCELHPDECEDVRDVKDYFYFNHGSYWVYEEENTGLRDSVYVIETNTDTSSVYFRTRLQSNYDGYDYEYWTKGADPSVQNNMARKSIKSTRVIKAKTKPGDFVSEATCFLFFPQKGSWTYTSGGGYTSNNVLEIDEVYKNFNIEEKVYFNVIKVTEQHTWAEESQPTIHYYSPNVGLVKKELIDSNQIWNLVNYHIEN